MQFNIEVISAGQVQTVPTKNGKSYQVVELAYKRDGKIEGKKIMSFTNPAVFKAVKELTQGQEVTVTAEKGEPNAAGQSFWNWVAIGETGAATTAQSTTGGGTVSTAKTVSNYETREERELKQRYIVRQSSITAAINLLGTKAKTVADVVGVAKQFEDYVFGQNQVASAVVEPELEDDIPL